MVFEHYICGPDWAFISLMYSSFILNSNHELVLKGDRENESPEKSWPLLWTVPVSIHVKKCDLPIHWKESIKTYFKTLELKSGQI